MGKRGPKPTPTKILKIRGSWRAETRDGEPVADGDVARPIWLKGQAQKKWDELVPILKRMDVIGEIDAGSLARYCDAWAWWRKLKKFIDQNGETARVVDKIKISQGKTSEGKDGAAFEELAHDELRPEVNIILKLAGILSKLESDFGLSPAARTNIKIKGKTGEVGKKRFFGQTG